MGIDRFAEVDLAENPEPRCPVVLLLDTSASMQGEPSAQLNQGLQEFSQAIADDPLASLRVEVGIVTFGGSVEARDVSGSGNAMPFDAAKALVSVDQFKPPQLSANGD